MQCPKCGNNESHVLHTYKFDLKNLIQRRRECLWCHHRFTTHEKMREPKKKDDK